jgi:CxxC motif-containing protein (DUF1111 family)
MSPPERQQPVDVFAHPLNVSTHSRVPLGIALAAFLSLGSVGLWADTIAQDPGVRGGNTSPDPSPGAGESLPGLSTVQAAFFEAGKDAFLEIGSVSGGPQGTSADTDTGLGPRFNLDSCGGCHAQPATGGSSPFLNPQVAVATLRGANNTVPFFVTLNGPVREARFKYNPDGSRDGGVHNLFTISGRDDAPGCSLRQPDFETEAGRRNLIFRIPTPLFGAGLIEAMADSAILENLAANPAAKRALGISGRPNRSGSDGNITRFGWKAQQPTLLAFAGEAYNVEQGVTNELAPQEREQKLGCVFHDSPEDEPTLVNATPEDGASIVASDVTLFASFMRFLASPAPADPSTMSPALQQSVDRGRARFADVGCVYCHSPKLTTGRSSVAALNGQDAFLFSDLALHRMGPGLADDILQGAAAGDEFRTAPLWGLGKRIFFLHDGRTKNLKDAILAHKSDGNARFGPSEANAVVNRFLALPEDRKQDLLNFLRSL